MPGFAAVYFDGDGTLWDFDLLMRRALTKTLEHLRKVRPGAETAALSVEALIEDRRAVEVELSGQGLRLEELRLRAFSRTLGAIGMADAELARSLGACYLKERFTDVPLFPDAVPALRRLSRRLPIGLLSNGNGYPDRSGLSGLFTTCVFADDHGVQKPGRRLFEIAARQIGAEGAKLVMVGDGLEADVDGALRAGWAAVWLNRTGSSSPCPAGASEIASLHQLSGLVDQATRQGGKFD